MEPLVGILNVAKPGGLTSRRVVDRVHRFVRPARCGHAGTLDPLATGVLVICIGQATRLIEYVQRMPKTYEATFLFGRMSDTEDIEGNVVEVDLYGLPKPTRAEIESAAAKLVGTIMQRPPAYSALKVQGRRSYDLARSGQVVDLKPRPVEIYGIDVLRFEYPEMQLRIRCGSGTYVRSLGRDLAESVGDNAVMSALVRTSIGPFTLADAVDLETITADELAAKLQPLRTAAEGMPAITVTADERQTLLHGKLLEHRDAPAGDEIAVFDESGKLVSLVRPVGSGLLKPTHNFA